MGVNFKAKKNKKNKRKYSKFPESKAQTAGERNLFIELKKLPFHLLKSILVSLGDI